MKKLKKKIYNGQLIWRDRSVKTPCDKINPEITNYVNTPLLFTIVQNITLRVNDIIMDQIVNQINANYNFNKRYINSVLNSFKRL